MRKSLLKYGTYHCNFGLKLAAHKHSFIEAQLHVTRHGFLWKQC